MNLTLSSQPTQNVVQTIIRKPKPHEAQLYVLERARRFNVLANARRWGKTKLAIRLAMDPMIAGYPVGYFVPTFEFAEDFWEEIKERLEPITIYKSESKRIIRLNTGGELKVWSLEKKRAGRGRKYKRAIVDEGAFVKDLKYSWEKVIRATLTDMQGDAYFLSSPIFGSYFHELALQETKEGFENWITFKMPTSSNPYITKEELKEIEKQLDPLTFAQEYGAEFVNLNGKAFAYAFETARIVPKRDKPFDNGNNGELRHDLPVYLSFDFNENPMTCIASQHPEDKSYIYTRHEFRITHADIDDLCDQILAKLEGHYFIITGDKSGSNATGLQKNLNYYVRIKAKLGLEPHQIVLPSKNPLITNSRVLTNSLFYRHPKIVIHPDCQYLIKDLEFVQMDENGNIDKKTNPLLSHLLDCLRYYYNSFFKSFVTLK